MIEKGVILKNKRLDLIALVVEDKRDMEYNPSFILQVLKAGSNIITDFEPGTKYRVSASMIDKCYDLI